MDRLISIGVNNNPKYLYYIPLVKWCWEQFGWETFVFFVGNNNKCSDYVERVINGYGYYIHESQYKSETVAQCSRMYVASVYPEDAFFMLSDADILPLVSYWQPYFDQITCYGRDLSDEHFPMCFVAMDSKRWKSVMDIQIDNSIDDMFRHIALYQPKAKNIWTLDQNILTDRLNKRKDKVLIDRGIDPITHYPIGRVDRSSWTLKHRHLIDCHAPHDILTNDSSFHKVMELLHTVWPKEDFKWFINYHREFKKLL